MIWHQDPKHPETRFHETLLRKTNIILALSAMFLCHMLDGLLCFGSTDLKSLILLEYQDRNVPNYCIR